MGNKVDTIFNSPLVFEVLGAGFQKPSNSNFYMLRHARVRKLHQDRSWRDCISFQELQDQAMAARAAPVDSESQETRRWIERLERKCRRKFEREKTATPKSAATSVPSVDGSGLEHRSSLSTSRLSVTSVPDARMPLNNVQNNSVQPQPRVFQRTAVDTSLLSDTSLVGLHVAANVKRKLSNESTPCPDPKRPCITISTHAATATWDRLRSTTGTKDCRAADSHVKCSRHCLLSSTTVYLPPCLRHTPYITETLLATHSPIAPVPCLSYLDRASFAHDCLSATVSESQSYPGMSKIVLVESKREKATEDVLEKVLALNFGQFQERVEVWDWRVLENIGEHVLGSTGRKWFLGATIWDEGKGCSIFVWNRSWK
jgi:DNA ligase-4